MHRTSVWRTLTSPLLPQTKSSQVPSSQPAGFQGLTLRATKQTNPHNVISSCYSSVFSISRGRLTTFTRVHPTFTITMAALHASSVEHLFLKLDFLPWPFPPAITHNSAPDASMFNV